MKKSIADCQRGLEQMAKTAQDYNYNLNKPGSNTQLEGDPKRQIGSNYNYNGGFLFKFVNSDPTMKSALEWGTDGKALYSACQKWGIDYVKKMINLVGTFQPEKRTGAYLMTVMKSRAPF